MRLPISALRSLLLLLALALATPVLSQPASPATDADAAVTVAPNVRAALDSARLELEQSEAALKRPNLSGPELQDLRARIDPVVERLRGLTGEIDPQLDAAKARLDQLGPKPKEGAPAEGADVARARADREAAVSGLDDSQRLARALLLQAEQITSQISDRRRSAFTRALFERSSSILGPDLWLAVVSSMPRDLRALRIVTSDALDRFRGRSSPVTLTLFGLAIGLAIALHIVRRHIAPRVVRRSRQAIEVDRRRKVLAALAVLAVDALPAALGSFAIYQLVVAADLVVPRLIPVAAALLAAIAFVAFARGAADAVLAPARPAWRLVSLSDAAADWTVNLLVAFATIVGVGKVIDGVNEAIAAGISLSVATRGVVALIAALVLAELLRRFAASTPAGEEACLGPYIPTEPEVGGPLRTLGWAAVAAIVLAALGGYVAFASFLVDQVAWIGSLAALLFVAVSVSDEVIGETLGRDTRLSTTLQSNLGLRRRSLERFGILGGGLARVVLVLAAILLALAPWGIESGDLASNLRAAFFGFRVGDVTISLSTTIAAIAIFGAVVGATRIVQRWLDRRFLPTTDLDAGLQNSIVTAIGYLGFFGAAAFAFGYLGLGLDRIAIVAGALSVGIGFGLQSIVNNFVSGLILLWERPIRVGDLVVIGDGEGYVRRISVRATEIETFDRSSVIIPNSNLISGVVKNRVRGDRTGRVILPVQVLRNQDPVRAAAVLVEHASRHPDVLPEPAPRVMFKKIGETWLDLDLVCFVDDVTKQLRVSSDLNFSIFRALVEEGILPPLGPGAMNIGGLDQIQAALGEIARALAESRREDVTASAPKARSAPPASA